MYVFLRSKATFAPNYNDENRALQILRTWLLRHLRIFLLKTWQLSEKGVNLHLL